MKKYFIIKSENIIHKWNNYNDELSKQVRLFKKFKEKYYITAHEFYVDKNHFSIVATKEDYEKFKNQFTKSQDRFGLSKFKIKSEVGREWKKVSIEEGVEDCHKPILMWVLKGENLIGRSKQNIFEIDGVVYGTLELDNDYTIEDGQIQEMKASEFYKMIEDYEKERVDKE